MKSRELSEESRRRLVDTILEDESNTLAAYKEPKLVAEAVADVRILERLRDDPVFFSMLLLGFKPTRYQRELLRCASRRIVVRWPRQSGKTRTLAAYTVWFSAFHAGSTTLIVAPSRRQSMIVNDQIRSLLGGMPRSIYAQLVEKLMRTSIYLKNGSRIVALPNSENLLRGYTADLIIVDEAAFFRNDEGVFLNILFPMLATTNGRLIVSSTPWGKDTLFYRFNMSDGWERLHATWRDAAGEGVYKPEFVEEIERLRDAQPLVYRMEYEAEFAEDVDTWLTQDLIAKSVSSNIDYLPFDRHVKGDFYVGVDLGERVDYSAVAVVRSRGSLLELVHMQRFGLGTNLAAVIGYVRILRQNWETIRAVYIDNTKHGDYIIQDFHEAGIPEAEGIYFTQESKQEMAQILRQRMQEEALQIPFDRSLIDELNAEKYQLTKTGRILLSHPPEAHDDRFWALALSTYAHQREKTLKKPTIIRIK